MDALRPNKFFYAFIFLLFCLKSRSQELFVFTDPASGLAARSVNLRLSEHYMPFDRVYDRPGGRLTLEAGVGLSKNWMISIGGSVSNMHTFKTKPEALFAETKFRFLSHDDIHRHFRMAAFLRGGYTKSPFHYDEFNVMGDKTGIEGGVIGTQLWNRFALSGTISHVQLLDASRFSKTIYLPKRLYQGMTYSLSTGYLVLPRTYTSYKQVNVNLYAEFLAQQALDLPRYYVDAAPAVQFIFFSNTRLNVGYRFQLSGTSQRMSKASWLFSVERSFLNVWKRKQKD